METGSVYRAKEKMKWVWLVPMLIIFITHFTLKFKEVKTEDYWFFIIIIGVMWNIVLTSYVIKRIWKNIHNRHIEIILKKVINYHKMSLIALQNKDFKKVKVIIDDCLPKYDSSSIMTHFIYGAYIMGIGDNKQMSRMLKEINKIEL